jgi:Protein of unknown function (DUF4240)
MQASWLPGYMPRPGTSIALLAIALVAVAGAYVLGSRGAVDETAAVETSGDVRRQTATPPAVAAMDQEMFWRLIADTRAAADSDTGRQSQMLDERLRRLPPRQIADFERIRRTLDRRAYTWELWGAAYVVEDGCSDDCFRDFRAYLIALGRGPYETALREPDALATTVQDAETGDWENADDVAPDAYQSVTGEDISGDSSDLSGDPRGTPWDDDHAELLVQRYPRLAAKFR